MNAAAKTKQHVATRMSMRVPTLYCLDDHNRLLSINEPGFPQAPRFVMGRTTQGNIWHFRHDLPGELVQELHQLCALEPTSSDFTTPPLHYHSIRKLLAGHQPIQNEYRGPAYLFPEQLPHSDEIVQLSEELFQNHGGLEPVSAPRFPCAGIIADQQIASYCYCARLTAQAAEAGVETWPAFRGRGFAAKTVAHWAALIRKTGRIPFYSTWWANHASQRVANKLGLILLGEDISIT
ncbi:MAG: GNAT family N-acetyltransferase [Chloroflexota bacterium]